MPKKEEKTAVADKLENMPTDSVSVITADKNHKLLYATVLTIVLLLAVAILVLTLRNDNSQENTESTPLSEQLANVDVDESLGAEGEFNHLLNVANQYKYEEKYEEAAEYYNKASAINGLDKRQQALVALESYKVFSQIGNTDKFKENLQTGIDWLVSQDTGDNPLSKYQIAELFLEAGNNTDASTYYLEAKALFSQYDDEESQEYISTIEEIVEGL